VAIRITDPDTVPDSYRDTGKTCLGGDMHCFSASSFFLLWFHATDDADHSSRDQRTLNVSCTVAYVECGQWRSQPEGVGGFKPSPLKNVQKIQKIKL